MNGMNFGALTPEQQKYIMENLPDLTGQEDELKHQRRLAELLRVEPSARMDWASQLGRAASGIGSGIAGGSALSQGKKLGGLYGGFARGFPTGRSGQQDPDEFLRRFLTEGQGGGPYG